MKQFSVRFRIITVMILVAALSRIIPHPYNFTPLVAIALFSGSQFNNKKFAFIVPLAAYLISDSVLQAMGLMGSYSFSQPFVIVGQLFVYAGMILVTLLGTSLKSPKAVKIFGYSLTGSAIFWIISNFGVWVGNYFAAGSSFHEVGLSLGFTYLRALPFYNTFSTELFANAFLGDLFYTSLLFGVYSILQKKLPVLNFSKSH
ncbi:MAG: hypothetical protein E6Q58_05285 [Niabella sp.]|nr:MAG: hypothetical protein E6Q58_05285 [Niabella sp.]